MKKTIPSVAIIIILFFSSCRSVIVQHIEMMDTHLFTYNVESLTATNITYTIKGKDTTKYKTVTIQQYDEKNNIIKQIDYYPKNKSRTTYFNYNVANLLVTKTVKNQDSIDVMRNEYFYNKKNRLIELKTCDENGLCNRKMNKYDSKNNKIMERLKSSKRSQDDWITLIHYNYKKRFFTYKTLDTNYVAKYKTGNKTYFDKKGYLTKFETYTDEKLKNLVGYSIFEYDESGNIKSQKSFDRNGKIKSESLYVNKYNSFGNIIQRDSYSKNQILESSTIVYKFRK